MIYSAGKTIIYYNRIRFQSFFAKLIFRICPEIPYGYICRKFYTNKKITTGMGRVNTIFIARIINYSDEREKNELNFYKRKKLRSNNLCLVVRLCMDARLGWTVNKRVKDMCSGGPRNMLFEKGAGNGSRIGR